MPVPIMPVVGALLPTVVNAIKNTFTTPKDTSRLDKDDFLKLLVAQLKNQNPLNPLSNDQFISQSASFSSLEQLQNIGKTLDTMAGGSTASAMASGAALLGRPVTATAAAFQYTGAAVGLPYSLPAPVDNALLEVTDGKGAVVARVPLGPQAAGPQSFSFHSATIGRVLPAGQYRYRILSADATGTYTALPAISGAVTSVSLDQGAPVLALGPRKVLLADLATVGGSGQ